MVNGDAKECVAVIPDATYGLFYEEMVKDCVANGQYDVTTMGDCERTHEYLSYGWL